MFVLAERQHKTAIKAILPDSPTAIRAQKKLKARTGLDLKIFPVRVQFFQES